MKSGAIIQPGAIWKRRTDEEQGGGGREPRDEHEAGSRCGPLKECRSNAKPLQGLKRGP